MKYLTVFISALFLILLLTTSPNARIINIPDDQETIQEGIDASESGDTVLVQPGTYHEFIDFSGKNITVASLILTTEDEAYIDSTIIDADTLERSGAVFRNEETEEAVLTGFTIRNGLTDYGGGIYCNDASPTLHHLMITENEAERNGGGIYITQDASPVIDDVVVSDNRARSGGGLCSYLETVPTITNSLFTNNVASESGGGIHSSGSTIMLSAVDVIDNMAQSGGGVSFTNDSQVRFENGVITGNTCEEEGAAIIYEDSEIELDHVLITNNHSQEGETLISGDLGEMSLVNVTIACNQEGLWMLRFSFCSMNLVNTILAGSALRKIYNNRGSVRISFSNIGGGQEVIRGDFEWREGNIDEDPRFRDIENNDYHLAGNSPCIDAGDPESPEDPDSTRADMGAFPFFQGSALRGFVLDATDDSPLEGADVITSYRVTAVTNEDGFWFMPRISTGDFNLTASCDGYLDSTLIDQHLNMDDTLEVTFRLLHSEFIPSEEFFDFTLEKGDSTYIDFLVENNGNGQLEWSVRRGLEGAPEPWGLCRTFHIGEDVNDGRIQGVVFIDNHFYVSGSNCWGNQDDTDLIYVFSRNGILLDTVPQPDEAEGSWGFRDLAWDGELIWGSGERNVFGITNKGEVEAVFEGPCFNNHALAWDPDREVLWISHITQGITAVNRRGDVITEINRCGFRIYGLAYWSEDPDGYPLYVFHNPQGDRQHIHKINPDNGDTLFVRNLEPEGGGMAGGAFITNKYEEYSWTFIDIVNDGTDDRIDVWQLAAYTSWMRIEPSEGSVILPDDHQDFTLSLTTNGLNAGMIPGELIFTHNAAGGETVLPVDLTVTDLKVNGETLVPKEFSINAVYPNPFNTTTLINYSLDRSGFSSLKIFDIAGREVAVLHEGYMKSGDYSTLWNGEDIPSGVYFCRLVSIGRERAVKVVIIR